MTSRSGGEFGEHEPSRRVGAVGRDDLVRIDGVAPGLRHFLIRADLDRLIAGKKKGAAGVPVRFDAHFGRRQPLALLAAIGLMHHHALGEEAGEGLVDTEIAALAHRAGEEARIEKMQDRVLDAADILIDRQPMIGHRRIVRRRGIVRIGEAHEVPRRIDERVHRVGLARRRSVALRTGDVLPCRMTVERVAGLIEAHVFRQLDRQVLGRDRHNAAFLAMDDRDRAAPIALAGNAPVAELVVDLPLGLRLAV